MPDSPLLFPRCKSRVRVSFPRTNPNGRRDLDLLVTWRGRLYGGIGEPLPLIYGTIALMLNRPGRWWR